MRAALGLLLIAAGVLAQDTNLPRQVLLLARIKEKALDDLARVPNYTCIETIERYRRIPRDRDFRLMDRVHVEVAQIEGTERFAWPGSSAFEQKHPAEMVGYGAGATGDFAGNVAGIFKNPATTVRYVGNEPVEGRPAVRFDYETPAMASGLTISVGYVSGAAAIRGSFWADPESLDVLRVEVRAHDIPPEVPATSAVTRTDYWRVRMGGRNVLLTRRSDFTLTHLNGEVSRNQIIFTNCREFHGETTITFAGEPTVAVSSPPPIEQALLPPGLRLTLALDTAVDPDKAIVGTPIRAHVVERTGDVPNGARVHGQVRRIIRYDQLQPPKLQARRPGQPMIVLRSEHYGEILIGLEFTEIEYGRRRAPFAARLIEAEREPARRRVVQSFGYFGDGASVQYDSPGVANLYLSASRRLLPRGLTMLWLTVEPRERSR